MQQSNDRKYTAGQTLCYIEEEYYPWRAVDKDEQLMFYVALLREAIKHGIAEISWDIDYIGERANILLNDQSAIAKAKSKLEAQECKDLEADIIHIKNHFLIDRFNG